MPRAMAAIGWLLATNRVNSFCWPFLCPNAPGFARAFGLKTFTIISHSFPRQLGQHVQEDAHRGHALTALGWAPDGDILFSGDASGMLLAVHGDFANVGANVNVPMLPPQMPLHSGSISR